MAIAARDRNFSTGDFDRTLRYIVSKLGRDGLYQPFDESEKLSYNPTKVTNGDFNDAAFNLKTNFCTERINDLKSIGKKLYPNK
jgi:hypothetical protein